MVLPGCAQHAKILRFRGFADPPALLNRWRPRLRLSRWGRFLRESGIGPVTVVALALLAAPVSARNVIVVGGGSAVPLGDADTFSDPGSGIEVRFRHSNAGHSSYDLNVAYFQSPVSGVIPETIQNFEALVRQKNLGAQEVGQPGQGTLLAQYGKLEIYHITANFSYRFYQRARVSPVVSVGGGLYVYRLPFTIQFFNVPSFGEQRAYQPMGDSGYQFTFDSRFPPQIIDYTKRNTTGGLNAAVGLDLRANRHWGVEVEGRTHLIFSSGDGVQELPEDDQPYLDNMTLLYLEGSLYYRF